MRKLYPQHKERRVSSALRYEILSRDIFRCVLCGSSPKTDSEVQLQIDHIIPFSKGGKTEPGNLQTLCKPCNVGKSNKLMNNG